MTSLPPYAEFLGIVREGEQGGNPLYAMPFSDVVLGRPGFLHGGAIAALLEIAAFGAIAQALGDETLGTVKPISVSFNFMRGGTVERTFAVARVARLGRRAANVEAHAWQQDPDAPIAAAQMTFLVRRPI